MSFSGSRELSAAICARPRRFLVMWIPNACEKLSSGETMVNASPPLPSDYLPLPKASRLTGLSRRSLRRAIASGHLRAFRPMQSVRGMLLIRRRDLVDWIEGSKV